jgi:hypothetical protein
VIEKYQLYDYYKSRRGKKAYPARAAEDPNAGFAATGSNPAHFPGITGQNTIKDGT